MIGWFSKHKWQKDEFVRMLEPGNDYDQVLRRVPDETAQARSDEIVAAYYDWLAQCQKVSDAVGLTAADENADRISDQLVEIGDRILGIEALSLKGLGIKASWALCHKAEGERDLSGVLQQVEAFARRHAYTYKTSDVAWLETEAMGGLPAADWEIRSLFLKWMQSSIEEETLGAEELAAYANIETDRPAYDEVAERAEQASMLNYAIREELAKTTATSMEGVRLKAHVIEWCCKAESSVDTFFEKAMEESGASSQTLAWSIARDLSRMEVARSLTKLAKQDRTQGSSPDHRALEAYRTWLSNEFRSLTAEMYPNNREMTRCIGVNNAGDRFHFRGEPPASTRAERMMAFLGLDWTVDDDVSFGKSNNEASVQGVAA